MKNILIRLDSMGFEVSSPGLLRVVVTVGCTLAIGRDEWVEEVMLGSTDGL